MTKPNFKNFSDDDLLQVVKVKIAKSKDVKKANQMILNQFEKNLKSALPTKISKPILRKVKDGMQFEVPVKNNIEKSQKLIKKEIKSFIKDMTKPTKRPALAIIRSDTNIKLKSPTKTKSGISDTRKKFNAAFKAARSAGKATFTFGGKKYTTKLKTDKKKTSSSLPKMVTLRSGKKGTIAQRLKEIDRAKSSKKILSDIRTSVRAKK